MTASGGNRCTRFLILALLPLLPPLIAACTGTAPAPPRAVILMIGDGMGFPQIAVSRILALETGERFHFERLPVTALVSTRSASNAVTDSSAAATAMASGLKTDNQLVGIGPDGKLVERLTERFRQHGWLIGYVTTTRLTHATPASFYARVSNRYTGELDIAAQLIEHAPDLAFGGGRGLFRPANQGGARTDQRDLLAEAEAAGFTLWTEPGDLELPVPERVLGLFAEDHLAFELDNLRRPVEQREPTLESMARTALRAFGGDGRPFFLLIEGGRIDHASHSSDPLSTALATAGFDDAIAAVLEFRRDRPETLVLVTADHATGGLAINDYADWQAFAQQKASVRWLADQLSEDGAGAELVAEMTAWDDLSEQEVAAVRAEKSSFLSGWILGQQLSERSGVTFAPRITDDTWGHTGEDVPLYAIGPGAMAFQGVLDNTDLPRILCDLLGWPPLNPESG